MLCPNQKSEFPLSYKLNILVRVYCYTALTNIFYLTGLLGLGRQTFGAHKCAMETIGNPRRQLHGRFQLQCDCIDDLKLRFRRFFVVDERQNVAVVFGFRVSLSGKKQRLSTVFFVAVYEFCYFSCREVHFSETGNLRPRIGYRKVCVFRLPAKKVLIHHPCFQIDVVFRRNDRPAS
ncbi:hypothetical protein Hanom_Chr10g00933821 [Helianthus anomalus]